MPAKKRPAAGPVVTEKKPGLGGTTFGGFQDPSYTSIDDGYNQKIPVPSRHLGAPANMPKWNPPCPMKVGRTQEVYFNKKTARLGEDEKYFDPGRSEKELKERAAAKKALLGAPWKNPNPTKQSTGPGSVFGTFQEAKGRQFLHEPEYAVPKKEDVPEQPTLQPKNITVQAGKRGGFGVQAQGVYFSTPEAVTGDKRDKYDAQKVKELKENEEHKKRILAIDKPFKSSSRSKGTFDEGVGGVSKIYTYPSDKKLPAIKEKDSGSKVPAALASRGPFKYSSPSKSGETGCLAPYTAFARMEGKVDKYDQKLADERDARKKAPKAVGTGPWMPAAGPKAGCTKSLLPKFH